MTFTNEQLKQWREDAEKGADSWTGENYGTWRAYGEESPARVLTGMALCVANDCSVENAHHIANACPQNFIALIDEVDRLRKFIMFVAYPDIDPPTDFREELVSLSTVAQELLKEPENVVFKCVKCGANWDRK